MGVEIYEGDIINFEGEGEYGEVKWIEDHWGYGLHWPKIEVEDQEFSLCGWIENKGIPFSIAGNIYENPELINQK